MTKKKTSIPTEKMYQTRKGDDTSCTMYINMDTTIKKIEPLAKPCCMWRSVARVAEDAKLRPVHATAKAAQPSIQPNWATAVKPEKIWSTGAKKPRGPGTRVARVSRHIAEATLVPDLLPASCFGVCPALFSMFNSDMLLRPLPSDDADFLAALISSSDIKEAS